LAEKIDPWGSAEIKEKDYSHVFKAFGLKEFPESMRSALDHRFFERGIVIAHRDFEKVFNRIQQKKPFINLTGIASSGNMHFGHKADLDLFKFFRDCGAVSKFAICDLDGYVSRPDKKVPSMKKAKEFAVENLSNALALGLSEKDVYVQSRMPSRYYEFAFELSKKITANTHEALYGHLDLGKISANLLQYADILHLQLPEFAGKMPSVTGIGLDQDPHARLTRDIAKRLFDYSIEEPSFIYFRHQSGLQEGKKMSSSEPDTAIFLSDSPKEARRKIMKAFTGGQPTVKEHREKGGNPDICKVCEMLRFHYPDTKKLEKIFEDYRAGKILDGENKEFTAQFVEEFLERHQQKVQEKLPLAKEIVLGK